MISTQSGVWLRPAILGGFGGTSDRSFLFICGSLALREIAGEESSFHHLGLEHVHQNMSHLVHHCEALEV
jgi:hypothetical protein